VEQLMMKSIMNLTKREVSFARTVFGGFIIHLVLGSLYIWANITDAVTSYLRIYQPTLTYSDTLVVFAVSLAGQGLSMFAGGLLSGYIGCQYTCLIGGYIIVLGTFLSGACTTLPALALSDGLLFGAGMGLCYTAPISAAVKWMPEKKVRIL
jgi:OFA family oxalate/formate antiporter-like MFS transporter